MSKQGQQTNQRLRVIIIGFGVVTAGLAVVIILLLQRPVSVVANFEQCKAAGGALLESYPEQCLIERVTFMNTEQQANNPSSTHEYIGLTEADALAKAQQANIAARVLERDGQALPATMDFREGRHNLYIKDGKVYKVEIEGQATDTPG